MVEPAFQLLPSNARWRSVVLASFVSAAVAGFWATAGLSDRVRSDPALSVANDVALAVILVGFGIWLAMGLSDRTSRGLGHSIHRSAALSLVILFGASDFSVRCMILIEKQDWLRVTATVPILLLMIYVAIAPYPLLMKDWRARRAAGGI